LRRNRRLTGTIILLIAIPETMLILGFAVAAMIIFGAAGLDQIALQKCR